MITRRVLSLICGAILVATAMPVFAITADSTTWGESWEGTTLPYASGQFGAYWFDGSPLAAYESSHTALQPNNTMNINASTGALWYTHATPITFNFATGASVEWRIKSHYGTANAGQDFISIDTGSQNIFMNLTYPDAIPTGKITFLDKSMAFAMYSGPENDFHTFRLTALGSVAKLFIDNNPIAALTTTVGSGVGYGYTGHLEWGDKLMATDFDYVRWTNAGAFDLPEPATMGLLLVGGLTLFRRKNSR
jgi:hypothetical protein